MGQLRVQAQPNTGNCNPHQGVRQMAGYPKRKPARRVLRVLIEPYRPAWCARCTAR